MLPEGPQGVEDESKRRDQRCYGEQVPVGIAQPVRQGATAGGQQILPQMVAGLFDIHRPVEEKRDQAREYGHGDPVIRRLHE